MKVLVVYYSTYGHVHQMAAAVGEGVSQVGGAEAVLRRVPETLPLEVLEKMGAVEAQEVKRRLLLGEPVRPATEVAVEEPDLVSFDCLLDDKEVLDGFEQGREEYADWTSAGAAPADVP